MIIMNHEITYNNEDNDGSDNTGDYNNDKAGNSQ